MDILIGRTVVCIEKYKKIVKNDKKSVDIKKRV